MARNILKVFYLTLTTIFLSTLLVECKREAPKLIDDESGRQLKQVSECQFGKTIRELGSSWFADLGPPFGVMYCIKCECVPVAKKKRIVARVQCRNIKNECPPANCDDPILLPGKCCKTCPGDNNTEMIQDQDPTPSNIEEEERNMKHFAALLTGKTSHFLRKEETTNSYSMHNPNNLIATGRFNFQKKNLYYSFYVSANKQMGRPTTIQFVNDVGTILEEHNLTTSTNGPLSVYEKSTGKICGVWRRIPKDYKRLLRDGRLHVVLLWRSETSNLAIGGKIDIYKALSSEQFSTLLESSQPSVMNGAGGTAIISTTTGAASSVHLTLVFNGIFMADDQIDIPVNIRIENPERKEIILEEAQKVHKPQTDINTVEISSPISIQNLRSLSRGKLLLTIESKKYPNLRLQGQIVTRTSCEMFQTLMTPPNYESKTKTSGLAWMYLNTDGSLIYNIQTDQLDLAENPELRLIDDNGKNKILEDLTKSLNHNQAVGTIDKLAPRVLESLYAGDLAVNVATPNETTLIKGRFVQRPVADARDSAEPILLKRRDIHSPANFMGLAWLAIDNDCNLHYDISLNGYFGDKQIFQIYLEEKPIDVLGAPTTRKLLEEFTGSSMEGFNFDMSKSDILKLESSVCYLEIYSKDKKELLLRGKLKSTKVPNHCHPVYDDNNIPSVVSLGDGTISISPQSKCYHSKKFYDEAEQWRSTEDQCTMCSCQSGQAVCEPIKCPAVKCKAGEKLVLREGECCKVCEAENSESILSNKGCKLGDQFHLAGSSWHPYLPPNGFDTCTTCTCDIFSLKVRCSRMACPKLSCPEKLAYRPDKKACCKVCPIGKPSHHSVKTTPDNPNVLRDEGTKTDIVKTPEEILSQGGCKAVNYLYENGQEWHPILASHGEQKCIKCRCKDGKVSCDRKRCSRSCNNSNGLTNGNRRKQQNSTDSDCCPNCRRHRRHQGTRRSHRDRNDDKVTKTTNSNRS